MRHAQKRRGVAIACALVPPQRCFSQTNMAMIQERAALRDRLAVPRWAASAVDLPAAGIQATGARRVPVPSIISDDRSERLLVRPHRPCRNVQQAQRHAVPEAD
jgi:hypothetical protein